MASILRFRPLRKKLLPNNEHQIFKRVLVRLHPNTTQLCCLTKNYVTGAEGKLCAIHYGNTGIKLPVQPFNQSSSN